MDTLKRSTFALAIKTFWGFVFIYKKCIRSVTAKEKLKIYPTISHKSHS